MTSDTRWFQADVMTLSDLEQVRILADPLRLRMLEAFCQERTTKQVAELLGEKPTRLYHHLGALESAGLVRLTRTAQNRGTTEKYYRAVARGFRADPRLFADAGGETPDPLLEVIESSMERTRTELRALFASGEGAALEEDGLHTFVEIVATPGRAERLRERLLGLIEEPALLAIDEIDSERGSDDPPRRYRLTIALFPIVE